MSKQQRWSTLMELLAERGQLDVEDVAAELTVSAATIRRDLDELAAQQMLVRTRGGAVAHSVSYELPLRYKTSRHAPQKQRIAQAAADLVAAGDVVGLNGGTTTTETARVLALRHAREPATGGVPGLTVVTNALNIAAELAVRPQIKIVVTGGVARPQSYELVGPLAAGVLNEVVLDIAVLGVDGLDPERGLMTHQEDEAGISRLLADRAHRLVVAADSSKIGRRAFARICSLDRVHYLVTDAGIGEEDRDRIAEAGVKVVTV
ncbi:MULTISPECIES: DeoR/GlpR family DNA-binding transcription regulator [unclassified Streptomyces]|uniref:DeoR/GlpR family DNA-binding transcription regulator n=1 Tax=unclassified Streptomyces TaxID=2593676 RepID=UPI002E2B1FAC|nr:DeoR/GlpR family DNA-binding transcription regulator [Streptomyces sp. NBC_00223]